MIVDSSVVIAVLKEEAGFERYVRTLDDHRHNLSMSAATYVETSIVADEISPAAGKALDRLIRTSGTEIVPFTQAQARVARQAYQDFGRGSGHPARLNLGDCFAYALAIDRDEPLLYRGDDFGHTDVRSALDGV